MLKLKKNITSLLLTAFILLNFQLNVFANNTAVEKDTDFKGYYNAVVDFIKTKYSGTIDESKLQQGDSLKGIFDTLDKYTLYMTSEEAENFFNELDNQIEGIGVTFEDVNGDLVAKSIFDNSPAFKAGVRVGDILEKVDGKNVSSLPYSDIINMIRGKAGTKVLLSMKRDNSSISFYIERAAIQIPPGDYKIIGDVGYIKLEIFSSNSADFIEKALKYMDDNYITKIILDLRDNPGGEVGQAAKIASILVPKGIITTLDYKDSSERDVIYTSELEKVKYKTIVLVNGRSASASEIVSGAIQDTKAGELLGTKTYGKAKFQSLIPLLTPQAFTKYEKELGLKLIDAYDLYYKHKVNPTEDELTGWVKITTGRYYTPKGRMIDTIGLTPDYIIENPQYISSIDFTQVKPLASSSDGYSKITSDEVITIKNVLASIGYFTGKIDANINFELSCALMKLQRDSFIPITGVFDNATRIVATNIYNNEYLSRDNQLLSAIEMLSK